MLSTWSDVFMPKRAFNAVISEADATPPRAETRLINRKLGLGWPSAASCSSGGQQNCWCTCTVIQFPLVTHSSLWSLAPVTDALRLAFLRGQHGWAAWNRERRRILKKRFFVFQHPCNYQMHSMTVYAWLGMEHQSAGLIPSSFFALSFACVTTPPAPVSGKNTTINTGRTPPSSIRNYCRDLPLPAEESNSTKITIT